MRLMRTIACKSIAVVCAHRAAFGLLVKIECVVRSTTYDRQRRGATRLNEDCLRTEIENAQRILIKPVRYAEIVIALCALIETALCVEIENAQRALMKTARRVEIVVSRNRKCAACLNEDCL